MENIINTAILVATLYAGTMAAEKFHDAVREAALTKAAQGLPSLSKFASGLTRYGYKKPSLRATHQGHAQRAQRRPLRSTQ